MSQFLCHNLSKAFAISEVITSEMCLSSSASLMLCVIIVKTSAIDLEERKPYCFSLRSFVDDSFKRFSDETKVLKRRCYDEDEGSASLLYTRDMFQRCGKHFSFRPPLKDFSKIGYMSGTRFLRTTTCILCRPVAFLESRF